MLIDKAFKEYLKDSIRDNRCLRIDDIIQDTDKLNIKQLKNEKELEAQTQKMYNNLADDC